MAMQAPEAAAYSAGDGTQVPYPEGEPAPYQYPFTTPVPGYESYGGGQPDYQYQQQPYNGPMGPPQGGMPFPQVSPFESQFNQTRQEGGLWVNQTNNGGRKWYGGIDVARYTLRRPTTSDSDNHNQVGYPVTLQGDFDPSVIAGLAGGGATGGVGGGVGGGGVGGATGGTTGASSVLFGNAHYIRQLQTIENPQTWALLPFFGFNDPDESGFEAGGLYVLRARQGLFNNENAFPVQLNRGSSITGILGTPLTFDTAFTGNNLERIYGIDANMITTPVLGRGTNRVRLMYGLRYFGANESLTFDAKDSTTGFTHIETSTVSQLIGPQIGARWEMGGNSFKLIGTGKVGALANFDKADVNFVNYGGNTGNTDESHLHCTPFVDFGFRAEMPLFGYLPLINKIPILKDGIFRVGYNYTGLFLMTRPGDSINYDINNPILQVRRSTFDMHGYTLGIRWNF